MQICPKCGYTRESSETVPDWQCPKCGIAYAKYVQIQKGASRSPDATGMAAPGLDAREEVIAEYQRRKREFQPRWNRNWAFLFLPGFLMFGLGGGASEFSSVGDIPAIAVFGVMLAAVGVVRALTLVFRYCRCPACNQVQWPAIHFPYRTCASCGQRLSQGVRDST